MGNEMQTVFEITAGIFAIVAAYFLYSGFTLATSVTIEGQAVANLELMHIQSMNFATGIGAAIIAAVLLAASAIIGAIRRASSQPE